MDERKQTPARPGWEIALSLIFAALSVAGILWGLWNLHPETAPAETARVTAAADVAGQVGRYARSAKAVAFTGIAAAPYVEPDPEPVHYVIPEGDLVAPAPDPACYGSLGIDRAAEVLDVIQTARDSGLLGEQDMIFDPGAEFYPGSEIRYYCDDTILVVCWKELISNTVCSCVEVKLADASQFRRKIVDDTFGSPVKLFATSLAKSTNAVVAMNADFYMFRDFGIMAYQRQLYRFSETAYSGGFQKYNCIDTLLIDGSGSFHYFHRGDTATWEEMQHYIDENDILFSISFGPILIEHGEVQTCTAYPAGEWNTGYSRAGLGQFDELHYFYMNVNHEPGRPARWTVNTFAEHMYEKGLREAYCLDGGQTGEIVFQGVPYNHIDFGEEREVSDIIYFATAIPETEETP